MIADKLASIPLFASLSKREREEIARAADEVDVEEGKHLAEQGRFAYEFMAIEEGTADVLKDGEKLRELGPGDFFGELAAREWVGGFSYPRLATVVACSPLRLLVLTDDALEALVQEFPELDAELRAAARERLAPR